MKALERLQAAFSSPESQEEGQKFSITPITFTHAASGTRIRRKGYSVRWNRGASWHGATEQIVLEPKNYSNGDRWFIYGPFVRRKTGGNFYAKNIAEAVKKLIQLI